MRRNRLIFFTLILICVFSLIYLPGCGGSVRLSARHPVTLTLWHNYGGQMKNTMDEMIDRFNDTIGAEKGIIINVTSISGSAALHDKLIMAADGDPGAPSLPDITTAYPKTALILAQRDLLVNLDEQFTKDELSAYIPQFIEEGRIMDGGLYVFPTAKSTEVLFVNSTIFNRFAEDTGASLDDLHTFEGLYKTAELYYDWTDKKTPDIPDDGKMFYIPDSLSNYALIGCKQLGGDFIVDTEINLSSPVFRKVWESYFRPAVLGHAAVFDGYATDLAKTGDIVCSTGSTAGVVFFSPTVTYSDNTSEPAELTVLPYPVFEGGKKYAVQRGSGMSVIKSTREKEYAAGLFLKWFTSPENNLSFVSSTGYLPVTQEAFGEIMAKEIENITDINIRKLLQTSRIMQKEYEFIVPPLFDGIDVLLDKYTGLVKNASAQARDSYASLLDGMDPAAAYDAATKDAFDGFTAGFSAE